MQKLKTTLISLCLMSTPSIALYATEANTEKTSPERTELDGLAGTFPIEFRHIIDQLKKSGVALKSGKKSPKLSIKNRLLLYGPTGNGKTTIAKKIAEQGEAHCIYKPCCEMLGCHRGESVKNIKETFDTALEFADKNKQPVVIVLDGIELLIGNKGSVEELLLSSMNNIELCEQLDRIDDDTRVFFIARIQTRSATPCCLASSKNASCGVL